MICKRCNRAAADVGYQEVVERRLVLGLHVILCLDCVMLFDIASLKSAQYQSLCIADAKARAVAKARAAMAGGDIGLIGLSSEYIKAALDAKRSMMEWTLEWLSETTD